MVGFRSCVGGRCPQWVSSDGWRRNTNPTTASRAEWTRKRCTYLAVCFGFAADEDKDAPLSQMSGVAPKGSLGALCSLEGRADVRVCRRAG